MIAHVPPAGADIRRLREAVFNDLLDRKPRRQARHQVPVVRKEEVLPLTEGEPEDELYALMPSARGMVRPTFRLPDVICSLKVEQPPKVYQLIPPPQCFGVDRD